MDIKVNVTEGEGGKRTLEVEVPAAAVEAKVQAAFQSYSKTMRLPGFRKGKVPVSIIKSRFGKAIEGEVLNEILPEVYSEAWKSSGIEPISQPVIDDVSYSPGEPLRFKASLEVKPEVDPRNYVGLRATRPSFRVREADVERQVQVVRERSADEQGVDRPAQLGDLIVADLQETDASGIQILGRKYTDRTFLIGGERSFSREFDQQMVGAAKGEERSVRFTYGQDLSDRDLAGTQASFIVKVKEIRERRLPALDDEFARDQGAKDLKEFKDRTREQLEAQAEYVSQRRLESSVVTSLIGDNPFHPPETMINNALDAIVEDHRKGHEGHDHPIDEKQIREQNRDLAVYQIRRHLLLEAVAKKEGLAVTDEEVDEHIRRMAEVNNQKLDSLKRILQRNNQTDRIRRDILYEKTLKLLIEGAQIEEVEENPEEEGRILTP